MQSPSVNIFVIKLSVSKMRRLFIQSCLALLCASAAGRGGAKNKLSIIEIEIYEPAAGGANK